MLNIYKSFQASISNMAQNSTENHVHNNNNNLNVERRASLANLNRRASIQEIQEVFPRCDAFLLKKWEHIFSTFFGNQFSLLHFLPSIHMPVSKGDYWPLNYWSAEKCIKNSTRILKMTWWTKFLTTNSWNLNIFCYILLFI